MVFFCAQRVSGRFVWTLAVKFWASNSRMGLREIVYPPQAAEIHTSHGPLEAASRLPRWNLPRLSALLLLDL